MIIESVGASLLLLAAIRVKGMSDKKKIETVFKNVKFGLDDKLPMYSWTHKKEDYTIYTYNLPYGLMDNPKLEVILKKTLNRPVKIEMIDSQLRIKVYKEELAKKLDYKFTEVEGWKLPVGKTLDGMVYHDFDLMPHMTVAGTTRWGKTAFMKTLVTHFIENHPDDIDLYILDLKGMLAFNRFSNLKQVKAVAGNITESANALSLVEKDMNETMRIFKKNYYEDILESGSNKRKFIIIDEAGELAPSKSMDEEERKAAKKCQEIMSRLARVSGGLGFRLIFGTQYPTADILDRQIKANSSAKMSFRLESEVQSRVAIDESGAEDLEYPGRAIYKTAEKHIVQAPFLTKDKMWEKLRRYEIDDTTTKKNTEGRSDIVTFEWD